MPIDISRHGDSVEKKYSEFINTYLPAYHEIWKRYIGNRGDAHLIDIPELSEAEKKRRISFSQYHYTCFESIICMRYINEKNKSNKISSMEKYIELLNDFISFNAHAGRIRDLVREMGKLFNREGIEKELENYYQQRNEVLHGRKLPFMMIDNELAIPDPKGSEANLKQWNSAMSWDEIDPNDFDFISSYFQESFSAITQKLNNILYKLLEPIKETINKLGIDLEQYFKPMEASVINDDSLIGPTSGSTDSFVTCK